MESRTIDVIKKSTDFPRFFFVAMMSYVQGGPSPRGLAFVDSNFKVTSQDGLLIAKRNFKFGVNIF